MVSNRSRYQLRFGHWSIKGLSSDVYSEKEQAEKEKYKIWSKRSKGASGCVTELSSVLRVIESLKKR